MVTPSCKRGARLSFHIFFHSLRVKSKLNHCPTHGAPTLICTTQYSQHNAIRHFATQHYTALHCTALHCTALHCTALHCTALHQPTNHVQAEEKFENEKTDKEAL
jgi:hypothetical protein